MIGKKDRRRMLFVVLLFSALCLWTQGMDKSIWIDEYSSIAVVSSEDFLSALRSYDHPPLYFSILKLWSLISMDPSFLRIPSIAFLFAAMVLLVRNGERAKRGAGLLAGLLFVALPSILGSGLEIRNYALFLLEATAILYAFQKILSAPDRVSGYIVLAVAFSFAVLTHLLSVLLIPASLIFLFAHSSFGKNIRWKSLLSAVAVPLLLFAIVFLFFLESDSFSKDWWMPAPDLHVIRFSVHSLVGPFWHNWFITNLFPHAEQSGFPWPMYMLLAAGGIALLLLARIRVLIPYFAVVAGFLLLVILQSLLFVPILGERTLIVVIPFVVLGIAHAVMTIKTKTVRKVFVFAAIVFTFGYAIDWLDGRCDVSKEDWKAAAALLPEQVRDSDQLIFSPDHARGPISFYHPEMDLVFYPNLRCSTDHNPLRDFLETGFRTLDGRGVRRIFIVIREAHFPKSYADVLSGLDDGLSERQWRREVMTEDNGVIVLRYERSHPAAAEVSSDDIEM